jgi:hypothetical protein
MRHRFQLGYGYQVKCTQYTEVKNFSKQIGFVDMKVLKVHFSLLLLVCAPFLSKDKPESANAFVTRLDASGSYAEVWQIVKDSVDAAFGKRRGSMMLFLDDLPLQVGAYYPVGTNNIVLNRHLVDIVEATLEDKQMVNALVYNLLLHEYLHALGELSETGVRREVVEVAEKCFGKEHAVTVLARKSPWILLKDLPLDAAVAPKRVMQIVQNFEKTTDKYIV